MVVRVPVNKDIIIWARKQNNLDLSEAAKKLRIKLPQLEKIENGEELPSATTFRKMSSVYYLAEATLLGESIPTLRELPKDHRTFDGTPTQLSHDTIVAIRKCQERQDSLIELFEMGINPITPHLPKCSLHDDPESIATQERERIGFPLSEQLKWTAGDCLTKWRTIVENLGVSVFVEDFPIKDARGISIYDNTCPVIILNQNEKLPSYRLFTLFHEYCHLLLRNAGISDFNRSSRLERFCNQFSAAFLLPIEGLKAVLSIQKGKFIEPEISELDEAAKKLKVSISCLALRLEECGFAPDNYYQKISARLNKPTPAPNKNTPVPQQYLILSHLGQHYTDTVLRGVEGGQLSSLDASRLLNASPAWFPAVRETIEKRNAK